MAVACLTNIFIYLGIQLHEGSILEKIYHPSENPVNTRLYQRLRELYWIKELGTAVPYDCNDQIKGVGTLSSSSCKSNNVLGIFNKQQRRKRIHGHRHCNRNTPSLDSNIDTYVKLISSTDQPQGVHVILYLPPKITCLNHNHLPKNLQMNLLSIKL